MSGPRVGFNPKKNLSHYIIEVLKRTVKDPQDNRHRNIIFPVEDAEALVENVYTKEDLERAFKDGCLYEAGELELNTADEQTAFDPWFRDVFKNQK
jgi:hypothetical protein